MPDRQSAGRGGHHSALARCVALVALAPPAVAQEDVDYSEVPAGAEDPLSVPVTGGIVWYGTWEDAMAEKERTGKPILLHFGSPRCPKQGVNVPGTW